MYTLKIKNIYDHELVTVLSTAGFPGEATVIALKKGDMMPFIEAARAHITHTRGDYDAGRFVFNELPAHNHRGRLLRGSGRWVDLFGGDRHGFKAHKGCYGEMSVEFHVHDTGASDEDSRRQAAISKALKAMENVGNHCKWGEWVYVDEEE